jgi:hypothetical protein
MGTILNFEATRQPDAQCSSPNWHATYVGWDDDAGPCTYMQRVAFDAFYAFVFPIFLFFPFIPLFIFYLIYKAYKRTKGEIIHTVSNPFLATYIGVLSIWFLFEVAMMILDKAQ